MIYPISFTKNICCACGGKGTLKFEQENGEISKNPIYSVTCIICSKCNTRYFIKWIPKANDNSKLVPTTTSTDAIEQFQNDMIEFSKQFERKLDFGGLA